MMDEREASIRSRLREAESLCRESGVPGFIGRAVAAWYRFILRLGGGS